MNQKESRAGAFGPTTTLEGIVLPISNEYIPRFPRCFVPKYPVVQNRSLLEFDQCSHYLIFLSRASQVAAQTTESPEEK